MALANSSDKLVERSLVIMLFIERNLINYGKRRGIHVARRISVIKGEKPLTIDQLIIIS